MNKLPHYAHKKDVFSDEYCDRIIEAGEGLPHDPIGTVGTGDGRVNLETRNTEPAFFPRKLAYKWIYEAILPCINEAAAAYWKFDVSAHGICAIQHLQPRPIL